MTPIQSATDARRDNRAPLLIGFAVALACACAGVASAQTVSPATDEASASAVQDQLSIDAAPGDDAASEDAGGDVATEDSPGDATDGQSTDQDQSAGNRERGAKRDLRLLLENTTPRKIYFAGIRDAKFEYKFAGARTADLFVEVVKEKGNDDQVIKRYRQEAVESDKKHEVRWSGRRAGGERLRKGKFYFRVQDSEGRHLNRKRSEGNRSFKMFTAIFPVRGGHQYWDGWGAGRGHEGQDVGADCGTKMVAAEPGEVAFKGYDGGGWGYYVVINVRNQARAELYAHLKRKATVGEGHKVKTGEKIGQVGATGSASGCHLHFEYWKGDWPGGHATSAATKRLKAWDKYS